MAQIYMLKGLPPDVSDQLNAIVADLGVLEQQLVDDVILSGRDGVDVTSYQAKASALQDQIKVLQADLLTLDVSQEDAWKSRASSTRTMLLDQLDQLAAARESAQSGFHYKGLLLGLGVSAIVATIGIYVFEHRRR